jgi:hypothetical protein
MNDVLMNTFKIFFQTVSSSGCERISFRSHNIPFDIHPEGQHEINNQGGTHRKKGNIDKPGAYSGSGDSQTLPDCRTHSE